jgi:predicted nucleotidyltransferase
MSTIGIIAEFNPFHNGHSYLIEEAKRRTGADNVVVVMSGNYVQSGSPAFMDKFSRARTALENGVDLVIELPFCYSMSSASYFATGAISILNKLGIVSHLCFGCEYDNLKLLNAISDIIIEEDDIYKETLQSYLKSGVSFVKSRENAIIKSLAMREISIDGTSLSDILTKPNNILAIEYLTAIKKTNSHMIPVAIKRENLTNSNNLIHTELSSAHSIRNLYYGHNLYSFLNIKQSLESAVPLSCINRLEEDYKQTYPINSEDYSQLIGKSLLDAKYERYDMSELFDCNEELSNRLCNMASSYNNVTSFLGKANAPTFTSSRIRRVLMYSLFGYTKEDFNLFKENDYVFYFRILGFNKDKEALLSEINNNSSFPMITKISTAFDTLSPCGKRMLELNMLADEMYRFIIKNKYKTEIPTEQEHGVIVASS